MAFTPATKFSDVERRVLVAPEYFVATVFRGRMKYDTRRADTLEAACAEAQELYEGDRNIMIYAVAGGFQAMVGSWRP